MDALTKFRLDRNLSKKSICEVLKNLKGKSIPDRTLYHLQVGNLPLKLHHVEQLDRAFKLTPKEKRSLLDMVEKKEKVPESDLNFIYSLEEMKKLVSIMETNFPEGLSLKSILDTLKIIKGNS